MNHLYLKLTVVNAYHPSDEARILNCIKDSHASILKVEKLDPDAYGNLILKVER